MKIGNGVEAQTCFCAADETVLGRFFKNDFTVLTEEANQESRLFLAGKLVFAKVCRIGPQIFIVAHNAGNVLLAHTRAQCLAAQAFHCCATCQHYVFLTLNIR